MTRILLQYLIPLILPTLLYILWQWLARHQGKEDQTFAARVQKGPWFWLIAAGLALTAVVLAAVALLGGADTEGVYVPPRWEDGRVVPGYFK